MQGFLYKKGGGLALVCDETVKIIHFLNFVIDFMTCYRALAVLRSGKNYLNYRTHSTMVK